MTHDLFSYPYQPGFKEPTTSRDAARATGKRAPRLREEVFDAILRSGAAGLTADQAASALGEGVLSVRPRLSELKEIGRIVRTGERRKNESGMTAAVWRVT